MSSPFKPEECPRCGVMCTRSEGSVPSLSPKRAAGGGSCPAFAALERHELAALGGGE